MEPITEKGELSGGAAYKGTVHRAFVLRPQKVADSVDAFDHPRARVNDAYLGLAVLAAQIEKLGEIPKKEITAQLLLELHPDDLKELQAAQSRVEEQSRCFRQKNRAGQEGNAGDAKAGLSA